MGVKARGKRVWGMWYVVWGKAQGAGKKVLGARCLVLGKWRRAAGDGLRVKTHFSFGLQGFQEKETMRRSIHR